MAQVYQTVALYTTNKLNDPSPQPFNYYLDYTYDQLLDVAMTNLKLIKGSTTYVILYRASNTPPRWILKNETLRSLGATNGCMIHILPADIQQNQKNETKKVYNFEQNEKGNDATLHGKDGEIYKFKEDDQGETVQFGGKEGEDVFGHAPQPSAKSQIDLILESKRSPEREAEIHKMGAERGLHDEMMQWAKCLMTGYGSTPINLEEAAQWMKKASENGNPKALCNYGMMLMEGKGVPKDVAASLPYFKEAADKGYPLAQYSYGALLMKGECCERDPDQGFAYIEAAAEQGEPQAVKYMSHFQGH